METSQRSVGIVSMTRTGNISDAVRGCFGALGCDIYVYPWYTDDLYELIKASSLTHWFFTGNTHDYVTEFGSPTIDARIYKIRGKLMFFVCYSHQLLCKQLGSPIHTAERRIKGDYMLMRMKKDELWDGVSGSEPFMAWYKQYVHCTQPPRGWKVIARFGGHIAAMQRGHNYSFQVHPERRTETYKILENWLNMLPPISEGAEYSVLQEWLRGWSFFDPLDSN